MSITDPRSGQPDTSTRSADPEGVFELRPVDLISDRFATELMAEAPFLLAALRTICGSEAEAEDVLGATIEIATRHQRDLRQVQSLRPWLFRIATREAFRVRRRMRRFVRLGSVAEVPISSAMSSDESLAVGKALLSLPARTRVAVVLHHMLGLDVNETATALGVSRNTVKTQLRKGIAQLRTELGDD